MFEHKLGDAEYSMRPDRGSCQAPTWLACLPSAYRAGQGKAAPRWAPLLELHATGTMAADSGACVTCRMALPRVCYGSSKAPKKFVAGQCKSVSIHVENNLSNKQQCRRLYVEWGCVNGIRLLWLILNSGSRAIILYIMLFLYDFKKRFWFFRRNFLNIPWV